VHLVLRQARLLCRSPVLHGIDASVASLVRKPNSACKQASAPQSSAGLVNKCIIANALVHCCGCMTGNTDVSTSGGRSRMRILEREVLPTNRPVE